MVSGYAVAGGGRGIERVDISVDGGKTWIEAERYQKDNVPYASNDIASDKWAWVLFRAVVHAQGNTEIIAKAVRICFSNMILEIPYLLNCAFLFSLIHQQFL